MLTTIDGRTVGFDDVGEGPPLLLVHGFGLDRTAWAPQTSALSANGRCLAPDLPGFGESAPLTGPATIDAYADALAAFLDHAGVVRAAVCGLSLGGYVALALWRRHPTRVGALVLACTRATADTAEVRVRRDELAALVRREGSGAIVEAQLPGLLGRSTRRRRPELVNAVRRMIAAAPTAGVLGALAAMRDRADATPTLATITVPTLVVNGDEDVLTGTAEMRAMQVQIPGSSFQVIDGAGHLCNLERPAAFNLAVGTFLRLLPERQPEVRRAPSAGMRPRT